MKFNPKSLPEREFVSVNPGDGRVRANSARSGAGQGKGASSRFVNCKQCGFTVDKTITDHFGGTQEGNAGYGPVTKYADGHGGQTVKKGAGCPLCGSKNFV